MHTLAATLATDLTNPALGDIARGQQQQLPIMKSIIEPTPVQYSPNFKITNWVLHVTFEDGVKRSFFLGQDAKVAQRGFGLSLAKLIELAVDRYPDRDIMESIGEYITDHIDPPHALRDLEPWQLAVE